MKKSEQNIMRTTFSIKMNTSKTLYARANFEEVTLHRMLMNDLEKICLFFCLEDYSVKKEI